MRPILVLALAAAGLALSAQAATVTGHSTATITDPVGIDVLSNSVLPAVQTQTLLAPNSTSNGGSQTRRSNASLTVRAQIGDTLSMAVPASFEVIRNGGTEGLIVKTTTDTDLRLADGGVVVGGTDLNDGTMSVKVGGLVTLASANNVAPGPYQGTLVVLVQYN
jgi:hypothetical protein